MGLNYNAILDSVTELLEEMAKETGRPVSFSVVDTHADQVHFTRMDGAPERSIVLASNKAYTAARVGRDSGDFGKMMMQEHRDLSWFGDPRLTGIGGGVLIRDKQNAIIGAVGVSGRTMEDDMLLASRLAKKISDRTGMI